MKQFTESQAIRIAEKGCVMKTIQVKIHAVLRFQDQKWYLQSVRPKPSPYFPGKDLYFATPTNPNHNDVVGTYYPYFRLVVVPRESNCVEFIQEKVITVVDAEDHPDVLSVVQGVEPEWPQDVVDPNGKFIDREELTSYLNLDGGDENV